MENIELFKRPGDESRKPPAIPLKKRPEFVQDVISEMPTRDLAKKWKRYIAEAQPKTLSNWVKWAKELVEANPELAKAN